MYGLWCLNVGLIVSRFFIFLKGNKRSLGSSRVSLSRVWHLFQLLLGILFLKLTLRGQQGSRVEHSVIGENCFFDMFLRKFYNSRSEAHAVQVTFIREFYCIVP